MRVLFCFCWTQTPNPEPPTPRLNPRPQQVEHDKRARNHGELLEALKSVNQVIQHSARLRWGPPKARVVAACRGAIKEQNFEALPRIIRDGG